MNKIRKRPKTTCQRRSDRTPPIGYLFVLLAAGSLIAGILPGCGTRKESPPAGAPAAATAAAVAVDTIVATPADLVDAIAVVGTLVPRTQAEIKSEISGRVVEIAVGEWVRVRRGDPLARVDTREIDSLLTKAGTVVELAKANLAATQAGLAEAQVAAERARREQARLAGLKEAGLATQQALDEAASQAGATGARIKSAEAQVAAAAAQITVAEEDVRTLKTRREKAVIRAPFDGTIAERLVEVGEVVGEMQGILFRLVDNRLLDLTVIVPSAELARVRPGQELSFATDALPGPRFSGTVRRINPSASQADRSVRVTAEVANDPETLRGGLFVTGSIVTGRREAVLQAPRSSLLAWDREQGTAAIFVVDGGNARRRAVTTGSVQGESVEIASGLSAGERVVIRGGFTLKDGDPVRSAEAGR
ncbi:MAG: efflux RND transporter periplasmic adaptor subunit [Candidatus Methylomirabilia bacterium]